MIKNFLTSLNYPVLGFTLFALRLVAVGASVADAIALVSLAGLVGFQKYLAHVEVKKYNEKFEADVKIEFVKAADELAKIKSVLGAINVGSTFRSGMKSNG